MRRTPLLALAALALAGFACEPSQPPEIPVVAPPTAQASASAVPSAAPSAAGYAGHGIESVTPEILAEFAPEKIPSDVSRRIQALLDVRAPGAGMLSPDGKTLYFGWSITGVGQIFRLDGPQRFPVQLTGGEDRTSLVGQTSDGKWLLVSRDRKGEENPGLYMLDPKGGPLVAVQHKAKVQTSLAFVPAEPDVVYYRANDRKVESYAIYRYDIKKREAELVFDQDGIWSMADAAKDGRMLLVKEVGSNMAELFEYEPKTKALKPLFGQGEREDYEARYAAGEQEILVLTPKLGEFRRLYRWSAGKLSPVTPDIKHDVSGFTIDRAKTRVLYNVNEGGYERLHGIDAKTYKDIPLPAFPPADNVFAGSTTRDGKLTTFFVDVGNGPAIAFSTDWSTRKLTQWHMPSVPELDSKAFVRPTLESYPARDGTKIPMFVWRPRTCDKPCPVIVEFHGGPEGQASAGFNTRAQLFASAGFVFVTPNVRGSDGYGKTWLHADDGPKRLDILTDIEDCSKFIRAKWGDGGKPPRVGVSGGSYGGYSVFVAMTIFAGAYDAGAEIVGFSDIVTFLKNTAPYRRPLRISEYGDPEKDKDALDKLSPIHYIDKVQGPMLLMQGANDPRVPVGEAVQIQRALAAKKLASKLYIFPDEGHGAAKRENQALMLGHMLRFFEEHLMGKKSGG